jgi:acetyl-CoA carboxylase biotin carboxyl carrier protein
LPERPLTRENPINAGDEQSTGVVVSNLTPRDIESIVELFKSGDWNELELRYGESELFLSKRVGERPSWPVEGGALQQLPGPHPAPTGDPDAIAKPSQSPAAALAAPHTPAGHVVIEAPSLGTFYRAAKPGVPPFVEIGDQVTPETELCLIEVMKLFTTLRAGVSGTIAKILIPDGAMIERGQPLFIIDENG